MPLIGQHGSSGGGPRPFVSPLVSSSVGDSGVVTLGNTKGEAMSHHLLSEKRLITSSLPAEGLEETERERGGGEVD